MKNVVKGYLFLSLTAIIIFSGISQELTLAQENGDSLYFDISSTLHESANYFNNQVNVNNVNLSLPSSRWDITNIDVNFTDIKLGQKVVPIEVGGSSFKDIYKSIKGYGVQLNITEDIKLLGVYIYCNLEPFIDPISSVYVQINGYDPINHWPNSTVYGNPVPINISFVQNWYLQSFSEPISLTKGLYYLVINGSAYLPNDNSKHHWYLNEVDSNHTTLYTSKLASGTWVIEDQGSPFRHKLVQRTDQSYNPESINMTIKVNNKSYNITNTSPGSGNVKISNINLSPNETDTILQVSHNRTIELLFNVSYSLKLENNFPTFGTLQISESADNQWSITPDINDGINNYSIVYNFPSKWSNINVLRNEANINSIVDISYTESYIFIPNTAMIEGAIWEITANSVKTNFELNVPRTEFYTGQEIKFFLADPIMDGNYTFVLVDPLDDEINRTIITSPSSSVSFTYTIPANAIDGSYRAYVYWFNGTDGGVVAQVFAVSIPFIIDWMLVLIISIMIGIGSAITASSVIIAKRNRKKRIARKEKIFNNFMDILNLNYIIIIEKKSSLNIYDQAFTEMKFNSTLISGFLEAIRTFGIDLSGMGDHSQTIKLEYRDSKILMSDFKNFRLIFIMKDLPSPHFYQLIDQLSIEIENKYGKYLEDFKGNLTPFMGIEELLKNYLGIAFLYPLRLVSTGKTKIIPTEKSLITRAISIMKKNRSDYFYVTHLMKEKAFDSKEIETLFSLIDKGIFTPKF